MGSLHCGVGDVLVDELERNVGKFVDGEAFPSDRDSYSDEGSEETEPCRAEIVNCVEKSATFPSPDLKPSANEDDEEDGEDLRALFGLELLHPAVSLPLLSAMKGSREKQGVPARKLSVSWAPEVYDPIPNSLSHTVKSKQKKFRKDREDNYKHNHKKNGKKGQKGNSSRGSGGKDKKQLRKASRADKCYRTMDGNNSLVDSSGGTFDVGSPDYCGSSFLKQSAPKFHYSVAEAS